MARQYMETPEKFHLYEIDEYIDLAIDFAERLNPGIVIERFVSQSPKELLIAPNGDLKTTNLQHVYCTGCRKETPIRENTIHPKNFNDLSVLMRK